MPKSQNDIAILGATVFAIGTSQVLKFTTGPNIAQTTLRYRSGGSLEIVPIQLSGGSTGTSLSWTFGYMLGTTEPFLIDGPATYYLAASGATVVAQAVLAYTAGVTCL